MNWEIINGVTGIISATVAVISLLPLARAKVRDRPLTARAEKFLGYILASSCWALLVLVSNWLFEPFGAFISSSEEKKLFAAALCFPLIVGFISGWRLLNPEADVTIKTK